LRWPAARSERCFASWRGYHEYRRRKAGLQSNSIASAAASGAPCFATHLLSSGTVIQLAKLTLQAQARGLTPFELTFLKAVNLC
jgi:hypothetical protein